MAPQCQGKGRKREGKGKGESETGIDGRGRRGAEGRERRERGEKRRGLLGSPCRNHQLHNRVIFCMALKHKNLNPACPEKCTFKIQLMGTKQRKGRQGKSEDTWISLCPLQALQVATIGQICVVVFPV